jgi:hypothetical protein
MTQIEIAIQILMIGLFGTTGGVLLLCWFDWKRKCATQASKK